MWLSSNDMLTHIRCALCTGKYRGDDGTYWPKSPVNHIEDTRNGRISDTSKVRKDIADGIWKSFKSFDLLGLEGDGLVVNIDTFTLVWLWWMELTKSCSEELYLLLVCTFNDDSCRSW